MEFNPLKWFKKAVPPPPVPPPVDPVAEYRAAKAEEFLQEIKRLRALEVESSTDTLRSKWRAKREATEKALSQI